MALERGNYGFARIVELFLACKYNFAFYICCVCPYVDTDKRIIDLLVLLY